MKKWLVVLLVLLGVAAGAVAVWVFLQGPLLRRGLERVGSAVLGVPVRVREARLSLWSGQGVLRGLVVGNPEGYQAPEAFSVERVEVEVIPRSWWSGKVHLRRILIESPEVTFEGVPGENNLSRLRANLQAFLARTRRTDESRAGGPERGRPWQVDELSVRGAMLHVRTPWTGEQEVAVHVEDFRLTDLGRGPEGITGPELAARLLGELLGATSNRVDEALIEMGERILKSGQLPAAPPPERVRELLRGGATNEP